MTQSSISSLYASPTSDIDVELIIAWGARAIVGFVFQDPFHLFKYARLISVVVSKLFNASIDEDLLPEILKVALVLPISKAGLKEIINNYCPVFTILVLSKISEKLR